MNEIFAKLAMYMEFPFVRYAVIVGVLIALCSSLLGVTLVLKRFSFIGDGLSHVAFGALSVAWTPATSPTVSCPCTFKASVTGTGALTVMKDGEAFGVYSNGVHEISFFGSGTITLAFAYEPGENDAGGAVLSGFAANIGTVLILR